jgi:hypothetical protein
MNRVLQLRAHAAYVLGLARDAEQDGDAESTDALLAHVAALELEAACVLERATATRRGQ